MKSSHGPSESCAIESHSNPKIVIRRFDIKENDFSDQELERRGCDSTDNITRVMVFKETSSMDEDDSINSCRRMGNAKLGFQKKMKLSEESNTGITESFENFCETHKRMHHFNESRPPSSELGKIGKPFLQPTAERGIRSPQRPMTAGKLSEIAVNKYPDSIFKVYIPQSSRVIKKRVVPIVEMKPMTPPRSSKLTSSRISSPIEKTQEQARLENALKNRNDFPFYKTKLSVPNNTQPERCSNKAAGESSRTTSIMQNFGHVPKRITLITDISLTKEQEAKRLKERAMMKKRTMDSVKRIFPSPNDDSNLDFRNENDMDNYESDLSEDEKSSLNHKRQTSMSKNSSLKSITSITSSGNALTSKRSVTWGDVTDDQIKASESKTSTKMRKRANELLCQFDSSFSRLDCKTQRRVRSASESRKLRYSNSMEKLLTIKDKLHHNQNSEMDDIRDSRKNSSRSAVPFSKRKETCKRSETAERSTALRRKYSTDSDHKKVKPRFRNGRRDHMSRESLSKRKNQKERKYNRTKRCNCSESATKTESNFYSKENSRNSVQSNDSRRGINTGSRDSHLSKSRKASLCDSTDNFEYKRNAIVRKHNNVCNEDVEETRSGSLSRKGSRSSYDEDTDCVKRGRSTPSMAMKSTTYEEYSFGSSDSELCLRNSRRDVDARDHHQTPKTTDVKKENEDKPLIRIFGTGILPDKCVSRELDTTVQSRNIISELDNKQCLESNDMSKPKIYEGVSVTPPKTQSIEIVQNYSLSKRMSFTNRLPSAQDVKKEDTVTNAKSSESLERARSESRTLKKTTSSCSPITFPEEMDRSYLLVESYNVLTDVGRRDTNSSKSLVSEASNSTHLTREPPMLNIPLEECSARSNEHRSNTTQGLNNYSNTEEISNKRKVNNAPLLSNSSQRFKRPTMVPLNSYNEPDVKPESKPVQIKSPRTPYTRSAKSSPDKVMRQRTQSPKNVDVPGSSRVLKNNPTPLTEKSRSNISHQNDSKQNGNLRCTEKKSGVLQVPKSLEDRKNYLKKMLSKKENTGPSAVANNMKEKWNSTKMSITARKEKMLANIRETRADCKKVPTLGSMGSHKSLHTMTENTPEKIENPHVENYLPVVVETQRSNNNIISNQKSEDIRESSCSLQNERTNMSEEEYFQDLIVTPGARDPQPYSSTDILVSSEEAQRLEDNLYPYTNDTPEKPLCESKDSRTDIRIYKNTSDVELANKRSLPKIIRQINDENIPERDINAKVSEPVLSVERISNEQFSNSRSSFLESDVHQIPFHNNDANVETNVFTAIRSLSVESRHSDDSETEVAKTCTIPSSNAKKSPTEISKSPVFFRAIRRSRNSSTSGERSTSRRSKASSSGSSRRSGKLLERPPSRKPHMIESSDDDSDQDFLIRSQQSPMNIHADKLRYANPNSTEPQKKPPPSRMYSTLKDSPHSIQESIKSAIRDMQEESCCNDHSGGCGLRSSREEAIEKPPSRPSSRMSRKVTNMPKMSPGSVRILQEKASVSQDNPSARSKNYKECFSNRDDSPSPWVRSTRRQEFQGKPITPVSEQKKYNNHQPPNSPELQSCKPAFRKYNNINKCTEEKLSTKQKHTIALRSLQYYRPPWERVDLTPPESALQERALHEKKLGISSRVTTNLESSKYNNFPHQFSPVRNSRCGTPVNSRGTSTPIGNRTPIGSRSPTGYRTPVESRTPVENRSGLGSLAPVGKITPVGGLSPMGNRTSVRSRTPTSGDCKTPLMNRSQKVTARPMSKPLHQVPVAYRHLLESSSHGSDDGWVTAEPGLETSDSNIFYSDINLKPSKPDDNGSDGNLPSREQVLSLIDNLIEDEYEFLSAYEDLQSTSSLGYVTSCNSEGETFVPHDSNPSMCRRCSKRKKKVAKRKSIELNITTTTKPNSRIGLNISI